MTQWRTRIGQKGQVVILKEIRDKVGIREGSEVFVSVGNEDEIVIKKSSPSTQSYVDYFIAAYSKKFRRRVNIKKIIEEENAERTCIH